MDNEEYTGCPFPVPHPEVVESCIDDWFDDEEALLTTQDNPVIPSGYKVIARDPGDDLILVSENDAIYYCRHETGDLIKLAENIESFIKTIEMD